MARGQKHIWKLPRGSQSDMHTPPILPERGGVQVGAWMSQGDNLVYTYETQLHMKNWGFQTIPGRQTLFFRKDRLPSSVNVPKGRSSPWKTRFLWGVFFVHLEGFRTWVFGFSVFLVDSMVWSLTEVRHLLPTPQEHQCLTTLPGNSNVLPHSLRENLLKVCQRP